MLEKISLYLATVCEWLIGLLMIAMTVVVMLGVFYRYILGDALSWSEELARYIMIWMSFLAASILVREEGHISITVLCDKLSPLPQKILRTISDLASIVFLAMWGFISLESYEIVKYDISSGLNITLGWIFVSQPVCASLMLVQAVLLMFKHLRQSPTPDTHEVRA